MYGLAPQFKRLECGKAMMYCATSDKSSRHQGFTERFRVEFTNLIDDLGKNGLLIARGKAAERGEASCEVDPLRTYWEWHVRPKGTPGRDPHLKARPRARQVL